MEPPTSAVLEPMNSKCHTQTLNDFFKSGDIAHIAQGVSIENFIMKIFPAITKKQHLFTAL